MLRLSALAIPPLESFTFPLNVYTVLIWAKWVWLVRSLLGLYFASVQSQVKKLKKIVDGCTTSFDIQSMEMLVLGPFAQLTADLGGWDFSVFLLGHKWESLTHRFMCFL